MADLDSAAVDDFRRRWIAKGAKAEDQALVERLQSLSPEQLLTDAEALLKKHIDESGEIGASLEELSQVLPSAPVTTVRSLLRTLRKRGEAHFRGKSRAARWFSGTENG